MGIHMVIYIHRYLPVVVEMVCMLSFSSPTLSTTKNIIALCGELPSPATFFFIILWFHSSKCDNLVNLNIAVISHAGVELIIVR